MRVLPLSRPDLEHVVANMREIVRRECFAVFPGTTDLDLVTAVMDNSGPIVFIVADDAGVPVAAIGAIEAWSGSWRPWCFGTEGFKGIAKSLTRFVRKDLIGVLRELGFRRAECYALAEHTENHRWLLATGAVRDGDALQYGKNGETYVRFVWYNQDKTD